MPCAVQSLISIRNYNALKQCLLRHTPPQGLISIGNYNALKLADAMKKYFASLISIRNYNALKQTEYPENYVIEFNIHTKLQCSKTPVFSA